MILFSRYFGENVESIQSIVFFIIRFVPDFTVGIVALGNLERRVWSREDKYAPVFSSTAARLLVSMAVEDGRRLKQADCKNEFCNGILPEDEVCLYR